jgi:GH25 family lysozyme M1 (1,4-beta-N-acetylmuramidase)
VIVYTSGSFPESNYRTGWDRTDGRIALWLAHWTDQPGLTKYSTLPGAALHQYSGTGRVPGITGDVDLDATMPHRSIVELMA